MLQRNSLFLAISVFDLAPKFVIPMRVKIRLPTIFFLKNAKRATKISGRLVRSLNVEPATLFAYFIIYVISDEILQINF